MKSLKVEFMIDVEEHSVDFMKALVNHHLEMLVDFNSFPEIKACYNADAEVVND